MFETDLLVISLKRKLNILGQEDITPKEDIYEMMSVPLGVGGWGSTYEAALMHLKANLDLNDKHQDLITMYNDQVHKYHNDNKFKEFCINILQKAMIPHYINFIKYNKFNLVILHRDIV